MEYSIFGNVFKDVQHVQHETRLQGVSKHAHAHRLSYI